MKAELVNPFLEATKNVIGTMASTEATPGKPHLKEGIKTWGEVTGIIGLAGENVMGNMILSFDKASILDIVSKMLMEEFTEINDDIVDATGELTNMISGGAKPALSEQGYKLDMATPVVIVGKDVEMTQLTKAPIIVIPFSTPVGQFVVEACLTSR